MFCSPEAIAHSKWREVLEDAAVSGRVCAVVIDEAHCDSYTVKIGCQKTLMLK